MDLTDTIQISSRFEAQQRPTTVSDCQYTLSLTPAPADNADDHYPFPDGEHRYRLFERAAALIHEHLTLDDPPTALIHCQAGVSRSPAVATAALAAYRGLHPREVFPEVREVRSSAEPRPEVWESAVRYALSNAPGLEYDAPMPEYHDGSLLQAVYGRERTNNYDYLYCAPPTEDTPY